MVQGSISLQRDAHRYERLDIVNEKGDMMKNNSALHPILTVFACGLSLALMMGCSSSSASKENADGNAASENPTTESVARDASSKVEEKSGATVADEKSTTDSNDMSRGEAESASGTEQSRISEEDAIAQGNQVLEGTVRVANAEEIIKMQGVDVDPAAVSNGGTYAVLVFDSETDITGMLADGSGEVTRKSKMLGIGEHTDYDRIVIEYGDLDLWKSLDGQQVKVAAKAEDIWFPTDARLPLNEPSSKTVQLVS